METQVYAKTSVPAASMRPLCVDLDGTLVKSDTLVDSLLLLVRAHPLTALKTPMWALQGKAAFKAKVTSYVTLDAAHLPYNQPLLAYLTEQHADGRNLYLTTGADSHLAARIAQHLGIFTEVLASDGRTNLTGHNKLASLQSRFDSGFDYIGNASPDLPLLANSLEPMVANPDASLRRALKSHKIQLAHSFEDRRPAMRAMVKAIRPHHPAKDARMTAAQFQAFYPQWREFEPYIDPRFNSAFWKRVTTVV